MNIDKTVPFGHLHIHSEFSLKDSPAKVNAIVDKVMDLGMNFAAITEHGNMHSVVRFYNACMDTSKKLVKKVGADLGIDDTVLSEIIELIPRGKNMKQALRDVPKLKQYKEKYPDLIKAVAKREVKPILGVEAYVIPSKEMIESDDKALNTVKHHLVLLAKDNIGYRQLIKAVSQSYLYQHKTPKSVFPRMTYDLMKEHFKGGHIIALSSCIQGEIPELILDGKHKEAKEKAQFYESLFGKGNFYLELQNHGLPEEREVLPHLIKISKETGIPIVATNDVHYIEKEDARIRDMVVAMRLETSILDKGFDHDCGELYVKSYEEMLELFKDTPEAVHNTVKIANECNVELKKEKRFPKYDVPDGKSEEEYLIQLAKEGIYKRFPDFDTWKEKHKKLVLDRMDRELKTINKLHYAGYHLIVQDFINMGKSIGLVGPGRGSAVGSLVCYLIGITDVNPLKYDLIFERFLNEERVSDPDIDTDFGTNREKVIEYVRGKYGHNAVCNIATFGTLAARASIRYAGRVTGKPLKLCDRIAKMVPNRPGISLEKALQENPDLKAEYDSNRDVQDLIDDALLLEGLVVHTGIHAAGIIIADKDISDYIPIMYDQKEKTWVTQFDMTECEAEGLLKMDFLGLDNLIIIENTLKDIERIHGRKIALSDIDLNNKEEVNEVMKNIFAKGRTKAIFQFESVGMRNLLKRFQPNSIEDLILLNAAYRPGPLQYLDEIIDIKHKRKKPHYICSSMKSILELTYGKPIYQEQIMRMFNQIGGFSLGESDIIRRGMSKKKIEEIEKYLPPFKEQLIKAGAKPEDAEKFCEELIEFANYAFNKSHSAAYAIIAYYTAWLKHYYPVEYMANVLSNSSSEKLPVYIKECRDMGIKVLPPSVNESGRAFTPIGKDSIRFGLAGVKNVGKSCNDIIKSRESDGKFLSLKDFIKRMVEMNSRAVYKRELESLIMTGALDGFGLNRKQMMSGCVKYVKNLKEYIKKKKTAKRQETIEKARQKAEAPHFDPRISEYRKEYILKKEKELIGFYASGHPLEDYSKVIDEKADMMIGDISEDSDGAYVTLVGQISSFQVLFRKRDGRAMGKFVLEDLTGEVDCICFTKAYEEYNEVIKEGSVVILKGRIMADIERDAETNQIINMEVQVVVSEVIPVTAEQRVYITLSTVFDWADKAKPLFEKYPGQDPLFVYFEAENQIYESKNTVRGCKELEDSFCKMFGDKKFTIMRGA